MRRVHQREPDVVIAQDVGVAALLAARHQLERGAATELEALRALDRADAVQLPALPEGALLHRPAERQHAELEHVPRRVRLRAGVEQQPASLAPGQLARRRRLDRRDRVLERLRGGVAGRRAAGEDADAVAAEVVAQQLAREDAGCGSRYESVASAA